MAVAGALVVLAVAVAEAEVVITAGRRLRLPLEQRSLLRLESAGLQAAPASTASLACPHP